MEWGLSDGGDGIPVRAVVRDHEVTEKGVEDLRESSKSVYVMLSHTDACRLTGSRNAMRPTNRSNPYLPRLHSAKFTEKISGYLKCQENLVLHICS